MLKKAESEARLRMRLQTWVNTYPLMESFLEKGWATGLAPEIRIPGLQFGLFRLLWANYFVFHFLLKEPRVLGLVTHLANDPRGSCQLEAPPNIIFWKVQNAKSQKTPNQRDMLSQERPWGAPTVGCTSIFFFSFLALSLVSFRIRQC